jgi:hypothetical protein
VLIGKIHQEDASRQKKAEEEAAAKAQGEASAKAQREEEQERVEKALRIAEAEPQVALHAAEEARKKAEMAKAEEEAAALEAKKETTKVASLPMPEKALAEQQPVASDRAVLVRALQTELKRVGCDPGAIDGKWGSDGKEALRRFLRSAKIDLKTDEPSEAALAELAKKKRFAFVPSSAVPMRNSGTVDASQGPNLSELARR